MRQLIIALVCLCIGCNFPAFADEDSLEVGVTYGLPGYLNLALGKWWTSGFVLRGTGMIWPLAVFNLAAVQVDAGYAIGKTRSFRHYVAVSIAHQSAFWLGSNGILNRSYIGPTYGFHWHGISVQAGPAFQHYYRTTEAPDLLWRAQVGFTVF